MCLLFLEAQEQKTLFLVLQDLQQTVELMKYTWYMVINDITISCTAITAIPNFTAGTKIVNVTCSLINYYHYCIFKAFMGCYIDHIQVNAKIIFFPFSNISDFGLNNNVSLSIASTFQSIISSNMICV